MNQNQNPPLNDRAETPWGVAGSPSETSTGVNPDYAQIDHSREIFPPLNIPNSPYVYEN